MKGKELTLECGDEEVYQNVEEEGGEAIAIPKANLAASDGNSTSLVRNSICDSPISPPSSLVLPLLSLVRGVIARKVHRE